ncbi:MAG: hypothetical protein EPO68_01680 [Planctomycetota bacterium]|nr:MAG: hypothetical protein EPO68_01680 [Planctomycetota bacterium]
MKLHRSLALALSSALLAANADAQVFGPWLHDPALPFSVYVDAVNGSDSNSGTDPANALQTLPWAVFMCDLYQSFLGTPQPITLNVLPATYTLTGPLSLPAFGLSIEAYRGSTTGSVTITGSASNAGLLNFDRLVLPQTQSLFGVPDELPPSSLRGISVTGNTAGFAIEIDPSDVGTSRETQRAIEVLISQCRMQGCPRGLMIRNDNAMELEYKNVIVENHVATCAIGIEVINAWYDSDLFRSNLITGAKYAAMRFNGSNAEAGMLHPRVLSNTVRTTIANLADGFWAVDIALQDCSARIVNNTLGFVGGTFPTPATIEIYPDAGGSAGESIAIVNNLLFSPPTLGNNPPEIRLFNNAAFNGSLVVESNDWDNSGAFIVPVTTPVGPNNVGIANPNFVAAPGDLHLTATSPSVVNQGNQAYIVPGPTATITLNGQSVWAHGALDIDLDPRTTMELATMLDGLHRGSDQFIESGTRLRKATTAPVGLEFQLADTFGNLALDASGNGTVRLELDVPTGSIYLLVYSALQPMGDEMQHLVMPPWGSLAVDPVTAAVVLGPATTTAFPQVIPLALGSFATQTEAQLHLQALVLLPSGVWTFTNRVRVDIDGI